MWDDPRVPAPMMNHSRREIFTNRPSNKRKERGEGPLNGSKPSPLTTKALAKPSRHHRPTPNAPNKSPSQPSVSSNQLLAGYLAHEFLTTATLFGQPWDPAQAAEPKVSKPDEEKRVQKYRRYMEVADLLKTDGAHLPDMVNPTQLASLLHLG